MQSWEQRQPSTTSDQQQAGVSSDETAAQAGQGVFVTLVVYDVVSMQIMKTILNLSSNSFNQQVCQQRPFLTYHLIHSFILSTGVPADDEDVGMEEAWAEPQAEFSDQLDPPLDFGMAVGEDDYGGVFVRVFLGVCMRD